jgi:release factor glutamine methyltransferase
MLSGVPFVGLEIGFDQSAAVTSLLRDAGFASVWTERDLAGHERVAVGRR